MSPRARACSTCARYVGAWAVDGAARTAPAARCCVDSSQTALEFAAANAQRNGVALDTLREDAFDALQALAEQGERFDLVILDPPAFIKRKKDIPQGQAAYRKLNQLALALLADEGLLVSCSCSYHLAPEELLQRHPGRRAPQRALRADPRGRRPVARPSRASGHPRNALPEGVLLPRDARGRLNFRASC